MRGNKFADQKKPSYFTLIKLMFAAVVCVTGYFLFFIFKTATPTDQILLSLNSEHLSLAPEQLDDSDWIFWCTGTDPGMASGGTEYLSAHGFARKHGLAFNGPNEKTSETYDYNLIFVRADGSYSQKKVSRFSFEWNSKDVECWKRSESRIVLVNRDRLRVDQVNG